jgi:hypothetical protein
MPQDVTIAGGGGGPGGIPTRYLYIGGGVAIVAVLVLLRRGSSSTSSNPAVETSNAELASIQQDVKYQTGQLSIQAQQYHDDLASMFGGGIDALTASITAGNDQTSTALAGLAKGQTDLSSMFSGGIDQLGHEIGGVQSQLTNIGSEVHDTRGAVIAGLPAIYGQAQAAAATAALIAQRQYYGNGSA